jgi:hypothetical protein
VATVSSGDRQSAGIGERRFAVVRGLWIEMIVLGYISCRLGDCALSGWGGGLPSSSRVPVTGGS